MGKLIKDGEIVKDYWTVLYDTNDVETQNTKDKKNIILPLQSWNRFHNELKTSTNQVAVWLDSNEFTNQIIGDVNEIPLIALNFPVFTDGRSYSSARELRLELHYTGEIRAIGDVLRDQIFYMSRCGFNSFLIREDQDSASCLKALNDFQSSYQSTAVDKNPLFRRR